MTCKRIQAPGIDVFICGPRQTCFKCTQNARHACAAPGCERPLCTEHARKVGDEWRCAMHAPMTTNPAMPKPIGRP